MRIVVIVILKYMMEPSFFFGAMFVNYALSVIIGVASFIISKVVLGFVNKSKYCFYNCYPNLVNSN